MAILHFLLCSYKEAAVVNVEQAFRGSLKLNRTEASKLGAEG
jgi:hypothetical protein